MSLKFGRVYSLTIQVSKNEAITIQPPFTIEFSITRGAMSALNSMQIKIRNLGEKTRQKIFQDWFNPGVYRKIILEAGYGELSKVFQGNIFQAYSYRERTDMVTFIDARDGGFDAYNGQTSKTIQEGAVLSDVLKGLMKSFNNLQIGAVGTFSGSFGRPVVLDGNTYDLLQKYTGGKTYIDLEKIYALRDGDTISGGVPLINSATGLLGTPIRSDAYLIVNTLFEPKIILGQVVQVQSQVQSQYDGQYKVVGINHSGIISEAIGGRCESKFSLMLGTSFIGGLKTIQ